VAEKLMMEIKYKFDLVIGRTVLRVFKGVLKSYPPSRGLLKIPVNRLTVGRKIDDLGRFIVFMAESVLTGGGVEFLPIDPLLDLPKKR